MNKLITYENFRCFAYSNDKLIEGTPKGIVLDFFGLGGQAMFDEDTETGKMLAKEGIIFIVPYNDPWAWMNKRAVAFTDELVEVMLAHYGLDESTPIVSTGGSMGGLSALVYTRYARITPVCCVANCPVCDLPYHFTERHDLPRTLYCAFADVEGDVSDALKTASPLHLVAEMPKVEYKIFHCDRDSAVNIGKHSDVFVSAMKDAGFDVEYRVVKDREHCELTDEEWAKYYAFAIDAVKRV